MSARRARRGSGGARGAGGEPSLATGFLAALPLLAAYELGLALAAAPEARASAERVVALSLAFLGPRLQLARVALLVGCAALAWARARRARGAAPGGIVRASAREVGEGFAAGLLLAPALTLSLAWLGEGALAAADEPARSLATTLRIVGAAPWEELLFRVGVYGGLFLAARRALAFLGLDERAAPWVAELAALLGSALAFAWFHLDAAQRLLGASGEPFHAGLFLWRLCAGLLLGALFRWRGFGAAAWAHAVFNLGIALGVRP